MKHRNVRIRQLAVGAIGAITAISATAVFGVGAASATTTAPVTSVTLVPTGPTSVHSGAADQAVGNLTFSLANTFAAQDTLSIDLPECQTATDYIAFSTTPTIAVSGGSSTETAPSITPSLAEQSGEGTACTTANGGKGTMDSLVLTFGNSASSTGTTAWTVTLSGLEYSLGAGFTTTTGTTKGSSSGNIPMTGFYLASATGSTPQKVTVASNATLADYSVTANTPGVAVAPTGSDAAISNLVITEYTPGTVTVGTVSVTLSAGKFDANSTPTVTASGGGAVAGKVTGMGTNTLSFSVTTASSTAPATYTLSGLAVDAETTSGTAATPGPVTADVTDTDAAGTVTTLAPAVKVFAVIDAAAPIYGETADATSAALFETQNCGTPDKADTNPGTLNAVLATSDNFPDALSASYLAGQLGTAVIVTPTDAVSQDTLNALRFEGVQHVFVVGGPLAISPADISTLESTPAYNCGGLTAPGGDLTVTQIYGQTQYGTAEDVAEYVNPNMVGSVDVPGAYTGMYNDTTGNNGTTAADAVTGVKTAILAVGTNFPDAMAASAMAYNEHLPVLLTETDSLAPEAESAIVNLGIQQVIVMGGPLAISNNVVTQLMGLGVSTFRIAGIDATDTAQLLAQFELNTTNASGVADGLAWDSLKHSVTINTQAGPTTETDSANEGGVIVSRGDYFTDALSASALAGTNEWPIVLTENPTTVGQYLTSFLNTAGSVGYSGTTVYQYQVIGGPLAIAPATMTTISNALAVNSPS
jgi:putative cell wall-binding protein